MSDIDVHEIKLNLRYPNSRQEDITDAFMRGYQGAVKIGNDAVRRVKAEKEALERRIDELCQEVERLHADQAHWELGNCPGCPNVVSLQETLEQNVKLWDENERFIIKLNAEHIVRQNVEIENTKLRELMSVMAYCNQFRRDCDGCRMNGEAGTITERAGCDALLDCLRNLGIEVPS